MESRESWLAPPQWGYSVGVLPWPALNRLQGSKW
jgi:hypothetical protein